MATNAVSDNENMNNGFSRWDVKKNVEEHRGLLSPRQGKQEDCHSKKTARRQQEDSRQCAQVGGIQAYRSAGWLGTLKACRK